MPPSVALKHLHGKTIRSAVTQVIYAGETLVGMLAYCHEDDPEDLELYWIFRLMIDERHQQRGYGTEAMKLAIDEIKQRGARRICTMHKTENASAVSMYRKLGFQDIGFHGDGDVLLEMVAV